MRGGERRRILLSTALAVGAGATACSFLESVGDDPCATGAGWTSRGLAGATCVASVCTPPATSSVDAQVDAGGPWSCLDLTCAHPVAPATTTDVTGTFSLLVPGGFDGYLQVGWSQSYPQATEQLIGTASGTITAGQFTYLYLVPTS